MYKMAMITHRRPLLRRMSIVVQGKIAHGLFFAGMALGALSARAQSGSGSASHVAAYVTAEGTGQRLARTADLELVPKPQPLETEKTIFLVPSKRFQRFLGIGGALTDAAAETFYRLPKARQAEILKAYYDPKEGIGYSLGRTHINSCDFSSSSYTYVKDGDQELSSFDISHDLKYRIPFIKEVMATAGSGFHLFASPWSPPAWMKSNHDMLHGGKLLPDYADSWANYYVKFIQAYERQGVPIWGFTVQNEPMAKQPWESCMYSAEEERDFVKNHLGPAIVKAGLGDKKMIVWDHNRDLMFHRASTILGDPEAAKYVWGVGFHWYEGGLYDNAKLVNATYPEKNLLFTEGCVDGPVDLSKTGEWRFGERYGTSMINDFNSGAVGWTDWNVLLDERGGPNHVNNFCYAPMIGDTRTGELHILNSYYYIGHFSKFIRPGAQRIASSSMAKNLLTTAFLNTDNTLAVVVMNTGDAPQPFFLWLDNKAAKTEAPAHSIMTLVCPAGEAGALNAGI